MTSETTTTTQKTSTKKKNPFLEEYAKASKIAVDRVTELVFYRVFGLPTGETTKAEKDFLIKLEEDLK